MGPVVEGAGTAATTLAANSDQGTARIESAKQGVQETSAGVKAVVPQLSSQESALAQRLLAYMAVLDNRVLPDLVSAQQYFAGIATVAQQIRTDLIPKLTAAEAQVKVMATQNGKLVQADGEIRTALAAVAPDKANAPTPELARAAAEAFDQEHQGRVVAEENAASGMHWVLMGLVGACVIAAGICVAGTIVWSFGKAGIGGAVAAVISAGLAVGLDRLANEIGWAIAITAGGILVVGIIWAWKTGVLNRGQTQVIQGGVNFQALLNEVAAKNPDVAKAKDTVVRLFGQAQDSAQGDDATRAAVNKVQAANEP
jgi:hypothetical protein